MPPKEGAMRRLAILRMMVGAFLGVLNGPALAAPPAVSFGEGEPLPKLNSLFEQKQGWIGADGAHSVARNARRTLWLFSDTWVGGVRDGKRVDATIVNNSVAVQDGKGDAAKLRFVIRRNADRKPVALVTPADGRGWFWLQAGAYANQKLYLLLSQMEKTDAPGVFNFRQIGQTLGIVANPDDDPTSWRMEQRKLPCTVFSAERGLTFGAAMLRDGDYLYVYGTDEDIKAKGRDRYLIVARVTTSAVEDFAAWRFYHGGRWDTDSRAPSRMVGGMASECSVSYLPAFKQYVLVYTEGGLSARILARTAASPTGPWSDAAVIYRCPEAGWDKRIFCCGAKAHASLAAGDELIVSYVANSFDFWQVAADARLYFPRFIRVKLR
jgi:hypothetical protein